MPRQQKRTKGKSFGKNKDTGAKIKRNARQDLPEENLIIGEKDFISPKGNKYKIILTDEEDPYDEKANSPDECRKEE